MYNPALYIISLCLLPSSEPAVAAAAVAGVGEGPPVAAVSVSATPAASGLLAASELLAAFAVPAALKAPSAFEVPASSGAPAPSSSALLAVV